MAEIKEAIIMDNKIFCPWCNKCNGRISGSEVVKNFVIRCRGSRKNNVHEFVLNVGTEGNINA